MQGLGQCIECPISHSEAHLLWPQRNRQVTWLGFIPGSGMDIRLSKSHNVTSVGGKLG
jgi:hypothetical protein